MSQESYFGENFYSLESTESQYQTINNNGKGFNGTPLNHTTNISNILSKNDVNTLFFSLENVEKIQKEIIASIYNKSGGKYKIGKQSEEQLKIVMRSVYLQNSRNLPFQIQEQVNILNKKVLEYCVPNIYTEILQYEKYLKDSSSIPIPNERGRNVNITGEKTVEQKIGF